jgi:hypothetical protein
MNCNGRQRRIFGNLHNVCHDILLDAPSFPRPDPAGVDPDSLAADLDSLHNTIGRSSLDDVYELLQQISFQLCRSPIPDVYWADLEQSVVINDLIFCVHRCSVTSSRALLPLRFVVC